MATARKGPMSKPEYIDWDDQQRVLGFLSEASHAMAEEMEPGCYGCNLEKAIMAAEEALLTLKLLKIQNDRKNK